MANVPLPLVIVEWKDAWVKEESVSLEDAQVTHAPIIVRTIGWVLWEDSEGVSIANEHYDGSWRGRTFIPHGMITSVTRHVLSKPRARKLKVIKEVA